MSLFSKNSCFEKRGRYKLNKMTKKKSKSIALLGMVMLYFTTQLLSLVYALQSKNSFAASGEGFRHYIGEEFGGGVIFHLWRDSQGVEHGLILDKIDLSTSQIWSNVHLKAINSDSQSSWDGLSNSIAIVSQSGHSNSAAALCLNSTNGGQNDWYLPSILELVLIWNNYYTVARSLTQISGATLLQPAHYWSSTEHSDALAWAYNLGYGNYVYMGYGKWLKKHVRAIRAF